MIEAIIGWAWPYLLAIGGAVVVVWRAYASGKSAGKNEKEVEHARERAQDLERVRRAGGARPSGSVSDDPANRDNWK